MTDEERAELRDRLLAQQHSEDDKIALLMDLAGMTDKAFRARYRCEAAASRAFAPLPQLKGRGRPRANNAKLLAAVDFLKDQERTKTGKQISDVEIIRRFAVDWMIRHHPGMTREAAERDVSESQLGDAVKARRQIASLQQQVSRERSKRRRRA